MNKKILAVGCSYTKGHGLDKEIHDEKLWVNQLISDLYSNYSLVNLSDTGRNNQWIFSTAMSELIKNDYDLVLIGWSELERLNITVGLELYKTLTRLTGDVDIKINPHQTIKKEWLEDLGNRIRKITNAHCYLLDLVKYVNFLKTFQVDYKKSKILFVNSLLHISNDFFTKKAYTLPNEFDDTTKEIISISSRSDEEIRMLYDKIHNDYSEAGGIQEKYWLNLYQSLRSLQIDDVSDIDKHPGYLSQEKYFKCLNPIFKEKMNANK